VASGWPPGSSSGPRTERHAHAATLKAARKSADTCVVITYRGAQRWLAYLLALAMLVSAFETFAGVEHHIEGAAEWCLVAVLAAAGAAVPLALVLWSRSVGVRLSEAGIVSVGLYCADALRWHEVTRFFIDDRGPNRLAVYAGLADGSRVALPALQGWRWERDWLERVCEALVARLRYEHSREERQLVAAATFAPVRFGWRARARGTETGIRAAA